MSVCQTRRAIIMNIKLKLFTFILLFESAVCFAQTATGELSKGESLFKENNAKDAVEVLEYEILNGSVSNNTYNFLGLGYYQLGEYENSVNAFKRGIKAQPENKKLLSYNLGNTYYAMKDYEAALDCYSESIKEDPSFSEALLNRANALLMIGRLVSAKEDYVEFVTRNIDDPQREKIELLIQALEAEIARREEEARLLAEQEKAKWEEFDGNIGDKKSDKYNPDWEKIETVPDEKISDGKTEWERINAEHAPEFVENNAQENLDSSEYEDSLNNWEVLSGAEKLERITDKIEPAENWETLSADDVEEIKALDEENRLERERWLSNKQKEDAERLARENEARILEKQKAEDDEKKFRESLLDDMRKAEDERRKKLLEDVANSLQNGESTNLTSGAEDLMDYDLEGELD